VLGCAAVFIGGCLASVPGPNIRAALLNVNEPESRGLALALHATLDDLGKGLAPAMIALLITMMGRNLSFSLSVLGWLPCSMLLGTLLHRSLLPKSFHK
jgi:hypothetical protein